MQHHTDLDIFVDMMDSRHVIHDEVIEPRENPEYYITKAQHIREQFTDNKNYYFFLKEFITKYKDLDDGQKISIKEEMGIFEKEIPKKDDKKTDIKIKKGKKKTKPKPKLNMGADDY